MKLPLNYSFNKIFFHPGSTDCLKNLKQTIRHRNNSMALKNELAVYKKMFRLLGLCR